MTKLQFMAVSLGILGLVAIFSYNLDEDVKKTTKKSPRTKHYEYENDDQYRKMKVFKHQTWYGDTMLVTVDTTYFYSK